MSKDTLVYYDFFTQLRKQTDLPLDMDQYALFLELFVGGYAWGDKERLRRLCRALWLSLPKYGELFDREFDLAFERWARQARERSVVTITATSVETNDEEVFPSRKTSEEFPPPPSGIKVGEEVIEEEPPPPPPPLPSPPPTASPQTKAVFLELADTATEEEGESGSGSGGSILDHEFILTNHFLPVKERRLQQNWRYLRFKAEKKPGRDIDMAATVERCAREGGFIDFEYAPRIEYKKAFHFLIDHEGSMAAFEGLARQLVDAFRKSIPDAQVHAWYFHNYPGSVLFDNPYHTSAVDVVSWRARLRKEPAVLFVVSDAGAARGGERFERVLATRNWMEETRRFASQVLWLNPTPRSRWVGSSAVYIASFVPMVDISKQGIAQLPDLLKHL